MTTVDAITAGSGDTYRIERVYLDRDQAYGFAQDYNEIAPVEPVQVEKWQSGAPPEAYGGPYWRRAEWWARVPVSKRGDRPAAHPRRRAARRLRSPPGMVDRGRPAGAKVGHRKLAGVPKAEVAGLSNEKVRRPREHDYPGQSRFGGSVTEVISAPSCIGWKETGHGDSTFPPWCVMIGPWIDMPWNGSPTTS